MTIDDRDVGGYYGMHREILFFDPGTVIIMFHPFGNDDFYLEFKKVYADKTKAMESLKQFIANTPKPSDEESSPVEGNWQAYEIKVNESCIQLLRDAINKTIYLPDNGLGYEPRKFNYQSAENEIKRHESGEYVRFVRYRI